jgi:hypothetical protein
MVSGRSKPLLRLGLLGRVKLGEEAAGGAIDHLKGVLEAAGAAIVGIGDVEAGARAATGVRIELAQKADLGTLGGGGSEALELSGDVTIKGDDMVEAGKVAGSELLGDAVELDAVGPGGLLGAGVGTLAHVPGADAGGFDFEGVSEAGLFDEAAEDALRHRAAADVSETDE